MSEQNPPQSEEVHEVDPEQESGYGRPARAPEDSLWSKQAGVDFFVPPALSLEAIDYLSVNGTGPAEALRERFDMGPEPKVPRLWRR